MSALPVSLGIALDLGLEKVAADSTGNFVFIPQYFRVSEKKSPYCNRKHLLHLKKIEPENCCIAKLGGCTKK